MIVEISQATRKLLDERIRLGGYPTADEALRDALELLASQNHQTEQLKAKIARGVTEAERGQLVSPDVVLERIELLKRSRRARAS